jgi:phosphoglycerate dehydrogenase-like enzyme
VRILLTETAAGEFGERVLAAGGPGAELAVMAGDGTLHVGGETVTWEEADVEVAWPTADLFADGAPLRPFFGFLIRHEPLKWVQSPAAGFDNPVFATIVRNGKRLTTSHATDIPIAEYVLRSVLDHYQRPEEWAASARDRAWRRHDFREVHGSTWIVVGLGSIGTAVASRATAFGAHVIGVRRSPATGDEPVDEMITPAEIPTRLGQADVVVLSAPSTPETAHVVDQAFLANMKPASLLVNIARGALVDEAALVEALDRGTTIEAAVLDVTEVEPLPEDSPLWGHAKVTITPHDAAGGTGRFARAADIFIENLGRYLEGVPLRNEVTEADLP